MSTGRGLSLDTVRGQFIEGILATRELRYLRHRFEHAYTTYMSCVQALADASRAGICPATDGLVKEQTAFNELAYARMLLLDALSERQTPVATTARA
jgi:hypothetical protein